MTSNNPTTARQYGLFYLVCTLLFFVLFFFGGFELTIILVVGAHAPWLLFLDALYFAERVPEAFLKTVGYSFVSLEALFFLGFLAVIFLAIFRNKLLPLLIYSVASNAVAVFTLILVLYQGSVIYGLLFFLPGIVGNSVFSWRIYKSREASRELQNN